MCKVHFSLCLVNSFALKNLVLDAHTLSCKTIATKRKKERNKEKKKKRTINIIRLNDCLTKNKNIYSFMINCANFMYPGYLCGHQHGVTQCMIMIYE